MGTVIGVVGEITPSCSSAAAVMTLPVLPGSYAFTAASPHLSYGSRNVVTITDPNAYADVFVEDRSVTSATYDDSWPISAATRLLDADFTLARPVVRTPRA